jgi:hypothetical protein
MAPCARRRTNAAAALRGFAAALRRRSAAYDQGCGRAIAAIASTPTKIARAARARWTYGTDQSLRCRLSSTSTIGCTNSETLPPSTAISRTSVEDMKVYCSCGVMNTDSISGVR